jgi:hypothetical protein
LLIVTVTFFALIVFFVIVFLFASFIRAGQPVNGLPEEQLALFGTPLDQGLPLGYILPRSCLRIALTTWATRLSQLRRAEDASEATNLADRPGLASGYSPASTRPARCALLLPAKETHTSHTTSKHETRVFGGVRVDRELP